MRNIGSKFFMEKLNDNKLIKPNFGDRLSSLKLRSTIIVDYVIV